MSTEDDSKIIENPVSEATPESPAQDEEKNAVMQKPKKPKKERSEKQQEVFRKAQEALAAKRAAAKLEKERQIAAKINEMDADADDESEAEPVVVKKKQAKKKAKQRVVIEEESSDDESEIVIRRRRRSKNKVQSPEPPAPPPVSEPSQPQPEIVRYESPPRRYTSKKYSNKTLLKVFGM